MSGWKRDWSRMTRREPWSGVAMMDTLIEYDGPILVMFRTPRGDMLGLSADHNGDTQRFLVTHFGPADIAHAVAGASMREHFERRKHLYVVDITAAEPYGTRRLKVVDQHRIKIGDVPSGELPQPGAPFPDYLIDLFKTMAAAPVSWVVS